MRRRWLRSLLAATCVMAGDRCGLWAVGDGQGPQALIVGSAGENGVLAALGRGHQGALVFEGVVAADIQLDARIIRPQLVFAAGANDREGHRGKKRSESREIPCCADHMPDLHDQAIMNMTVWSHIRHMAVLRLLTEWSLFAARSPTCSLRPGVGGQAAGEWRLRLRRDALQGSRRLDGHLVCVHTHSDGPTWTTRIAAGEVMVDGVVAQSTTTLQAGQQLCWHKPPWIEPDVRQRRRSRRRCHRHIAWIGPRC
jgi:hypothetical protein